MTFFVKVSGQKLAFSSYFGDIFVCVNHGTISVYVFPKFDDKIIQFDEKIIQFDLKLREKPFFSIFVILLRLQPLFHCALLGKSAKVVTISLEGARPA